MRGIHIIFSKVLSSLEMSQSWFWEIKLKEGCHGDRRIEHLVGALCGLCLSHFLILPPWDTDTQHTKEYCCHQKQDQILALLADSHNLTDWIFSPPWISSRYWPEPLHKCSETLNGQKQTIYGSKFTLFKKWIIALDRTLMIMVATFHCTSFSRECPSCVSSIFHFVI